jgi:hypothetical protein
MLVQLQEASQWLALRAAVLSAGQLVNGCRRRRQWSARLCGGGKCGHKNFQASAGIVGSGHWKTMHSQVSCVAMGRSKSNDVQFREQYNAMCVHAAV